jgi:thiamine-monophosphate kinase
VSAVIDVASIPLSPVAGALLARGVVNVESLVSGGDDYEVLCTVPQDLCQPFSHAAAEAGIAVTTIGAVVAGTAIPRWLDAHGREIALERRSYSHF